MSYEIKTNEQGHTIAPMAEVGLICALLHEGTRVAEVSDQIRPDDFRDPNLRRIYEVMLVLSEAGIPPDIGTVCDQLGQKTLDLIGGDKPGEDALKDIKSNEFGSYKLGHYAKLVLTESNCRRLAFGLEPILAEARLEPRKFEALVEKLDALLWELTTRQKPTTTLLIHENTATMLAKLKSEKRGKDLQTGIAGIDRAIGGLGNSELVVIGARPSNGKSALAMQIAYNLAVKAELPTIFFSLEMDKDMCHARLCALHTGISAKSIIENMLGPQQKAEVETALWEIDSAPLYLDAWSGHTVRALRSSVRKALRKHEIKCVVVDYLQLVTSDANSRQSNRNEQVGSISRGLKQIAREFRIPLIACAQLNRKTDERNAPTMSDLRESGQIEADADVILLLHRPNRSEHMDSTSNLFGKPEQFELYCEKNRNGNVCKILLTFEHPTLRFKTKGDGPPVVEDMTHTKLKP